MRFVIQVVSNAQVEIFPEGENAARLKLSEDTKSENKFSLSQLVSRATQAAAISRSLRSRHEAKSADTDTGQEILGTKLLNATSKKEENIAGPVTGKISRGLMVLVGIGQGDDEALADKMIDKLLKLRIFADAQGKTNLSLSDIDGELMLVSQFTLYADCRRGNRPGFTYAAPPDKAETLYDYIVARCKEKVKAVETGEFGAYMKVTLTNDGPFTIILDSDELNRPRSESKI